MIATGLAKPSDRYPTAVDMASAAREVITRSNQPDASPADADASAEVAVRAKVVLRVRRCRPNNRGGNHQQCARVLVPAHERPPSAVPPAPPPPKRPKRNHGVLVGTLVFITTLIVVAGLIAVVEFTSREDPRYVTARRGAGGGEFTGTYTADYGPGTDLEDKPVPNAPSTTSNWAVHSECGAGGCVATAANVSGTGMALLSNLTFDQIGGTWVAVGLASHSAAAINP